MNYLAIISRSDFTNLYKFGHIHLHNLVPFEGNLKDHVNDRGLFEVVTKYIDTYEYDTEYLMLYLNKDVFSENIVEVSINDVKAAFALSEDAQRSIQIAVDSRINIQTSDWTQFFIETKINLYIRQAKAGIANCYTIFDISRSEISEINKVLPHNLVEEVYHDVFNNIRPSHNASIWNYLIRYERHNPYWNDKRGYFLDAVHAYENWRQHQEIEDGIADELAVGDIISACRDLFSDILNSVLEKHQNDYTVDGCRYFVVAPLYLYLKSEFREKGIISATFKNNQKLFEKLHSTYKLDFAIAIALLGLSLGHDLTYSYTYEKRGIGLFYKDVVAPIADEALTQSNYSTGTSCNIESARLQIESQNSQISEHKENISNFERIINQDNKINEQGDTGSEDSNGNGHDSQCVESLGSELDSVSAQSGTDSTLETTEIQRVANTTESDDVQSSNKKFEPIEMRKLVKDGTRFCKKSRPIFVHNDKEYQSYLDQNYAPLDYFENKEKQS